MNLIVKNENWPLFLSLNLLKMFGFLVSGRHSKPMNIFLIFYWLFWFSFLVGIYIIVQLGDLIQIWGDLSLMVNTSFLLLTMLVLAAKIIVVGWRSTAVQGIIDEGADETRGQSAEEKKIITGFHRGTTMLYVLFALLSAVTVLGWAASAEKGGLPLRAWYPYDTNRSPAFEITYAHQCLAIIISAALNVSLDTLMSTLIALCSCRMQLTALALRTLCDDLGSRHLKQLDAEDERLLVSRLRVAVNRHQGALRSAGTIQACFSEPILGQFAVSTVIICVTAYQIAVEIQQPSKNVVRVIAMSAYQLCMMLQVFLSCYQGNQLSLQSSEICTAAYESRWYSCPARPQRALLQVMARARRPVTLTAGGLTELSLATYTAIIKVSYTFFTVLQNVESRKS